MYKYTIAEQWKHYFKTKYWKYCKYYKDLPTDLFVKEGWPNTYECKYHVLHFLVSTVFYSEKKLSQVPVNGYLIPVKFFKEEKINV